MSFRLSATLVLALLLPAGCASSLARTGAVESPAIRLSALLRSWERTRGGCGDARGLDASPIVDCGRMLSHFEALALEFPRSREVLEATAIVAFEAGERAKTETWLGLLLENAPGSPLAALLRARLALADGNVARARRILRTAIRARPELAYLREADAAAAFLARDFESARRSLAIAERLGSPPWRIAFHRGLLAEGEENPLVARAAYERALELRRDFAAADARLRGLDDAMGRAP